MPTYCYQCQSCGDTREVTHSLGDPGPQECDYTVPMPDPQDEEPCGGVLKRLLYPVAGWLK